ncbi:DUF397 domain-containing protein [Salinactinospora qingdaonensis]|uniref:DUF397 domain-containing protein n=1 Tax=Salinactinospora qingdaonensis TaxID=702744 RepID=A0ABP7EZ67_9ACTN
MHSSELKFRKSSYSAGASECVEVAALPFGAAMRDSKHSELGHLTFDASEWRAFLAEVTQSRL